MALEAELELDVSAALDAIGSLDDALQGVTDNFGESLAEAIGAAVDGAAGALTDALTAAADAFSTSIQDALDQLGGAAGGGTLTIDTSDLQTALSDLQSAVSDLTDGLQNVGTSGGQAMSSVSGGADQATSSLLGTQKAGNALFSLLAAGGAGSLAGGAGLTNQIRTIAPGVAVFAGLAAAIAGAAKAGAQEELAQERVNQAFGSFVDVYRKVNIPGINEDLNTLLQRTGTLPSKMDNVIERFVLMSQGSKSTQEQIAKASQELALLSVRTSVAVPALGDAATIAGRIQVGLARGGGFLARLGIVVTPAEVVAQVMRDGGNATDRWSKSVATLEVAMRKYGGTLGSDINKNSQSAVIQFKALQVQVEENLQQVGKRFLPAVLDLTKALTPLGIEATKAFGGLLGAGVNALDAGLKLIQDNVTRLGALFAPVAAQFQKGFDSIAVAAKTIGPVIADVVRGFALLAGAGLLGALTVVGVAFRGVAAALAAVKPLADLLGGTIGLLLAGAFVKLAYAATAFVAIKVKEVFLDLVGPLEAVAKGIGNVGTFFASGQDATQAYTNALIIQEGAAADLEIAEEGVTAARTAAIAATNAELAATTGNTAAAEANKAAQLSLSAAMAGRRDAEAALAVANEEVATTEAEATAATVGFDTALSFSGVGAILAVVGAIAVGIAGIGSSAKSSTGDVKGLTTQLDDLIKAKFGDQASGLTAGVVTNFAPQKAFLEQQRKSLQKQQDDAIAAEAFAASQLPKGAEGNKFGRFASRAIGNDTSTAEEQIAEYNRRKKAADDLGVSIGLIDTRENAAATALETLKDAATQAAPALGVDATGAVQKLITANVDLSKGADYAAAQATKYYNDIATGAGFASAAAAAASGLTDAQIAATGTAIKKLAAAYPTLKQAIQDTDKAQQNSAAAVTDTLQKEVDQYDAFLNNIEVLRQRGATDLANQLADAGPAAAGAATASFAAASDATLKHANDLANNATTASNVITAQFGAQTLGVDLSNNIGDAITSASSKIIPQFHTFGTDAFNAFWSAFGVPTPVESAAALAAQDAPGAAAAAAAIYGPGGPKATAGSSAAQSIYGPGGPRAPGSQLSAVPDPGAPTAASAKADNAAANKYLQAVSRSQDAIKKAFEDLTNKIKSFVPTFETAYKDVLVNPLEDGLAKLKQTIPKLGDALAGLKSYLTDQLDNLEKAVPTLDSVLKKVTSVTGAENSLKKTIKDFNAFTAELKALAAKGFGDLAQQIALQGPEAGKGLARSASRATTDQLKALQGSMQQVRDLQTGLDQFDQGPTGGLAALNADLTAREDRYNKFVANLAALRTRGFTQVANELAAQGATTASGLAQQAVRSSDAQLQTLEGTLTRLGGLSTKLDATMGPSLTDIANQLSNSTSAFNTYLSNTAKVKEIAPNLAAAIAQLGPTIGAPLLQQALNDPKVAATLEAAIKKKTDLLASVENVFGSKDLGTNFATGFAAGIEEGKTFVADAAVSVVAAAQAAVASKLKTGSPSKVMMEVGGNFSEGFAVGIAAGTPRVAGAAGAVALAAVGAASGAGAPGTAGAAGAAGTTVIDYSVFHQENHLPAGVTDHGALADLIASRTPRKR